LGIHETDFPLPAGGVSAAGFLLGRPGHPVLIPEQWIQSLLGGNSLRANLIASVAGASMYFVHADRGADSSGVPGGLHGQWTGAALLPAGRALSLPNMLVIGNIMGVKKTISFCGIIVIMSTIAGDVVRRDGRLNFPREDES